MTAGFLTTKVAEELYEEFMLQGLHLIHDHRQAGTDKSTLGKIRPWTHSTDQKKMILADLDVAVLENDQVFALAEIEEHNCKPKVIMGDVMATLLGSHVRILGKDYDISDGTHLIILTHISRPIQQPRIEFLENQANLLKGKIDTPIARKIGSVVIRGFQDEYDLKEKLKDLIQAAWNERRVK
jgi:hypothetical protein